MPVIIWQQETRRCTVSVSGAAIALQLLDGDDLVDERAVSSADQALSLAEAWRTGRRAGAHDAGGATAVPRVMWIDRR